jgi:hypothetical protein
LPALEWIELSDCVKMAEKMAGNEVEDFLLEKVCPSYVRVCMCLGLWVILMKIRDIRLIINRYIIRTLLLVELYFLEIRYQIGFFIVWTVQWGVTHV